MDNIITSVLGFNFNVVVIDQEGEPIKTGAKTTYPTEKGFEFRNVHTPDVSFFTHYNEALLAKIRNFRRIND